VKAKAATLLIKVKVNRGCPLNEETDIRAEMGRMKKPFPRSCLFSESEPVTKLIFSTFQSCHCIASLMTLRRDVYSFSTFDLALRCYRSQTSDMLLNYRIQKTSTWFSVGTRTAMTSGRIHQNLSFPITSFDCPSRTLLVSPCVRG
jgi:hypothetical protein